MEPLKNLTVRSFIVNTWDKDLRMAEEVKRTPKILDIGWTEWKASTLFSGDLTTQITSPTEARHIISLENKMLQLRNSKPSVSSSFV